MKTPTKKRNAQPKATPENVAINGIALMVRSGVENANGMCLEKGGRRNAS